MMVVFLLFLDVLFIKSSSNEMLWNDVIVIISTVDKNETGRCVLFYKSWFSLVHIIIVTQSCDALSLAFFCPASSNVEMTTSG